jgi:hypothetical protein
MMVECAAASRRGKRVVARQRTEFGGGLAYFPRTLISEF